MSDEYASDNVNRKRFEILCKLIHFYKERISFLFYCEDGKRGAVSWLSQIQPQTLKGSVMGNTDLDNYTYYLVEFFGV
jgi:hypothetical protein